MIHGAHSQATKMKTDFKLCTTGMNIENSGSIKSHVHTNICINTSTYQIFQEYLLILTNYISFMN